MTQETKDIIKIIEHLIEENRIPTWSTAPYLIREELARLIRIIEDPKSMRKILTAVQ